MNDTTPVIHTATLCENCPITTYSIEENQLVDNIVQHLEHYAPVLAEDITHGIRKAKVSIALLPGNGRYALRKFGGNLSAGNSYLSNTLFTSFCMHYRTFVLVLQLTNHTNLSLRIAIVSADLYPLLQFCYFVSAYLHLRSSYVQTRQQILCG